MKITSFWINNTMEGVEVNGMTEDFKNPTDLLLYMAPMVDINDLCGFLNYANIVVYIDHPVVGGVYSVRFKRYAFPNLNDSPTPTVLLHDKGFFGILGSFFMIPVSRRGNFKHLDENLDVLCDALAEVLTEYENEVSGDIDSLICPQYRAIYDQKKRKEKLPSKDPFFYTEHFNKTPDDLFFDIKNVHEFLSEICEVSNTIYARMNLNQMKNFYELPMYTHYMSNTKSYASLIQKLEDMRFELANRETLAADYLLSFLQIKRVQKREDPSRFFYFTNQVHDMVEKVKSVVPFGKNIKEHKIRVKKMDEIFGKVVCVALIYDFLNDRVSFLDDKIQYLKNLTKNERN